MDQIDYTQRHVSRLRIDTDRRVADVETGYDPQDGIFNQLFATASTLFAPVADGASLPKLVPLGESFVVRNIFIDLKRHD